MPEGPEVKYHAQYYSRRFKDAKLKDIKIISGRYKRKKPEGLTGFMKELPTKILSIKSKGKFIYFEFDNGYYLWNTLGLTGDWLLEEDKYLRLEFITDNESLYFSDMRNFGTLKFSDSEEELEKKLASLGPDILDKDTTYEVFKGRVDKQKDSKVLAPLLLNQKFLSGIGNYIRSEALWYARLSPHRTMGSLSESDLKRLYKAIMVVGWTNFSIKKGMKIDVVKEELEKKSSDYNKMYSEDRVINRKYRERKDDFFVYKQENDIYGNPVVQEKFQGRMVHWVPTVQK